MQLKTLYIKGFRNFKEVTVLKFPTLVYRAFLSP